MKILAISDEECAALWEYYVPGRLDGYDLIISCGDLKADYLSFLVTMAKCPVLYVHGNHDGGYDHGAPEGCDCIDDKVLVYNGLRIVGLGGCRKYHPGPYQYTETQMRRRIRKLWFPLWRTRGVDILVTHAPAQGVGDSDDPAHWGFEAFRAAPSPIALNKETPISSTIQVSPDSGLKMTRPLSSVSIYSISGFFLNNMIIPPFRSYFLF